MTTRFVMSVLAPNGRTWIKFSIWKIFQSCRELMQDEIMSSITGKLYKEKCTFLIISRWVLLRKTNVTEKGGPISFLCKDTNRTKKLREGRKFIWNMELEKNVKNKMDKLSNEWWSLSKGRNYKYNFINLKKKYPPLMNRAEN